MYKPKNGTPHTDQDRGEQNCGLYGKVYSFITISHTFEKEKDWDLSKYFDQASNNTHALGCNAIYTMGFGPFDIP
jgi:hypothetical protein